MRNHIQQFLVAALHTGSRGEKFPVTADAVESDVARGLSAPQRCPKCRKAHGHFLNGVGAGYLEIRPASGK